MLSDQIRHSRCAPDPNSNPDASNNLPDHVLPAVRIGHPQWAVRVVAPLAIHDEQVVMRPLVGPPRFQLLSHAGCTPGGYQTFVSAINWLGTCGSLRLVSRFAE
jgi:hypothetical protein